MKIFLPRFSEVNDIGLRDEPEAYTHFHNFSEAEQKRYIDWIYGSKKEGTRIERMANAINKIRLGEKIK